MKYNREFSGFKIEDNILKGEEFRLSTIGKQVGETILETWNNNLGHVSQIDVDNRRETTNLDIKYDSVRVALWLRERKIGRNDIVTVCTNNRLDTYIPVFATLLVGATFNPWYHEVTLKTARYLMQLIKPKIIFACENAVQVLKQAADAESVRAEFVVFGKYENLPSIQDIIKQQNENAALHFVPQVIDRPSEDLAMILFSSGTTGPPKGVMHSYQTILNVILGLRQIPKSNEVQRILWYSSPYWSSGVAFILRTMFTNSTRILHAEFDPIETCEIIEKYKVTIFFAPHRLITMFEKLKVFDIYKLESVSQIFLGGSSFSKNIFENFVEKLPHCEIHQVYGMTEAFGSIALPKRNKKSMHSVGTVGPKVQIKIADLKTGAPLGPLEAGELCLKIENVMLGYYKNPEASATAIDDEGWLHSGDKAYYDEDGEIFIVDRLKEIMKFQGHQVSPTELEELLLTHPSVLEVAVLAIPHLLDGEHPIAFVKTFPGSEVTEEELIKLSAELADHKKLRGGVKFLEELPHTATGKVDRGNLRVLLEHLAQSCDITS